MSLPAADVEPLRSGDAACREKTDARRRAGNALSAWLVEADAEGVISQAERRHIAALAEGLSGKRVRSARR